MLCSAGAQPVSPALFPVPAALATLRPTTQSSRQSASLVWQWGPAYNSASGPTIETVNLGASVVENAVGGRSSAADFLIGNGEKNVLQPGEAIGISRRSA
jgi:hypothetical protein